MPKKQLRIGLIGYSFMGRAHSNAFHQVNHFFPSSYELVPQAVCGRDAAKTQEFANKWGYKSIETDWKKLIARDDIDVVDIASATNRLTLIAAVLPARVVTTHTLFCLKTPLPSASQHVLCALLNSFVANYLIRLRVNTHVTVALVARLPMPCVNPGDPEFKPLADLSRTLAHSQSPAEQLPEYAELQARTAHLFGIGKEDFEHILSTFPLIPAEVRTSALTHFARLPSCGTPRHRGAEG